MTHQWNPDDVFEVLADETVRQILVATNVSPRSARDLVAVCDGSLSAIYRRLVVMVDYGLLVEETQIDPDGHHHSAYVPDFDELDVTLERETITVIVGDTEHAERWPRAAE